MNPGIPSAWIHNARSYTNASQVIAEDPLTPLSMGHPQAMKNLLMALLTGASIFLRGRHAVQLHRPACLGVMTHLLHSR